MEYMNHACALAQVPSSQFHQAEGRPEICSVCIASFVQEVLVSCEFPGMIDQTLQASGANERRDIIFEEDTPKMVECLYADRPNASVSHS